MGNKDKLDKLVSELLELGESHHELVFWQEVFEHMTEEEQGKLLGNLTEELKQLKK